MPVSTDQALPRQPRRGLGASTTLAAGNQPAAGGTLRQIVAPGWEPVVAELVSRLRGGGLADEGPRGAFIVKQGQHRTVYRLAIAGQSLIVKHYPCSHWRGRLKHLVRGSTARREWHKTLAAAERGIDTIELVACLEQYTWGLCGDSYLVSRELPAAQPLDLYLAELAQRETLPHQPSDRRRIIDQLARFTAAVHRAGILHDDFHAGNILWQQNEQAAAPSRLVLIDLPGARLGAPLDWRHTRRGLAMLATSLGGIAQGTDIIRFFMYYLRERPDLRLDHRAGLLQLEQHTRSHAQRILRGRDGRSLRTNRDFRAIKSKAGRAHAIHDFPT
ncbi:MAG: lipopolysaccharide kinase InaA family protein, partial [Pirellulales bacterium]